MSETMQALINRRSIRKYKTDIVSKEIIEKVVSAGTYAANGMGRQETIIVAITNKEIRDKLAAENAKILGNEGIDPFYGAPVVLVVLGKKDCPVRVYDGSCVMENMMIAAHDLGLGSCWIHRAKEEFEMPEWKEWLKSIGVTEEYEGIGHCILGYVEGDYPTAAERKPDRVVWVN